MKQLIWKEWMRRFAAMFLAAVMVFMTAGEHAAMIVSAQGIVSEAQDSADGTGNDMGDNTDELEGSVAEDGTEPVTPDVKEDDKIDKADAKNVDNEAEKSIISLHKSETVYAVNDTESAQSTTEYRFQGTTNNLTWTIDYDGVFTLTGTGDYEITQNSMYANDYAPWGKYMGSIKKAIINVTDCTSLAYLFHGCYALKSVEFINLDTSSVTNMEKMFKGCTGLKTLDLTAFDTSAVTNMSGMFEECFNLETLNVSGFKTENVLDMSAMFSGCSQINSLNVSNWKTSNVTNMSRMFEGCYGLTKLDVSKFDTTNVTDMSCMFRECNGIKSLNVSSWKTSNVINMEALFGGCCSVMTLDVGGWKTSKVTDMSRMFSWCNGIEKLNLSSFDTSKVTNMSSMFDSCQSLETLSLSKFDTSKVTDMSYMFNGCMYLTQIDFGSFDTRNVTSMESMFDGCSSLTTNPLSVIETDSLKDMSYMFSGSYINTIDLSGLDLSNVEDMERAFGGFNVSSVNLTGVDTGNVKNMAGLFSGCSKIKTIDLSDLDTSSVTDMGWMFSGCEKLTAIDLSNFDTSNVTNVTRMFDRCHRLKTLNLSKMDFSKVAYAGEMIKGCYLLEKIYTPKNVSVSITFPDLYDVWEWDERGFGTMRDNPYKESEWPNPKFVWMDNRGIYCEEFPKNNKESVTLALGDSMNLSYTGTSGNLSWIIDKDGTFTLNGTGDYETTFHQEKERPTWLVKHAAKIVNADINVEGITSLEDMFYGCTNLVSVDMNDSDLSNVISMKNMFNGCKKLKKVRMEQTDIGKVQNVNNLFNNCSALTEIGIPKNVATLVMLPEIDYKTKVWMDTEGNIYRCFPKQQASGVVVKATKNSANEYSGICGELEWSIDKNGHFVLQGTGDYEMLEYKQVLCPDWTLYADKILTADINVSNITNLGSLFYNCQNLREINFNNIDTSKVTDMSNMFYNCKKLEQIDVSVLDTANVTNMTNMFRLCKRLEAIDLSSFDTANVTKAGGMFMNCLSLKTIDLSGFDFAKLENSSDTTNMFVRCYGLRNIYTPKNLPVTIITPNAKWAYQEDDFEEEFHKYRPDRNAKWVDEKGTGRISLPINCEDSMHLTLKVPTEELKYEGESGALTWTISKEGHFVLKGTGDYTIDTITVNMGGGEPSMNEMPLWKVLGEEIETAEIEAKDITNTSRLFEGCGNLTEVNLDKLDTSKVKQMSYMFSGCRSLAGINLEKFDTSLVEEMEHMFSGCSSLKEIDMSNFILSRVYSGYGVLDNCTSLKSIKTPVQLSTYVSLPEIINEDWEVIGDWVDQNGEVVYNLPMDQSESMILTVKEREDIIAEGTSGKVKWTISIAGKLTLTGDGDYVLSNGKPPWTKHASKIKSADVHLTNVKSLKALFYGCYNLRSINFNNIDTSQVTDMSYMFYNPYPEDDTSQLRELDLSGFDTSKVTDMTAMFSGTRMKVLDISSFDTSNVKSMKKMFSSCFGLRDLDLSHFNTSKVKDMSYMFAYIGALQNLDLTGFDTKLVKDMSYMFSGCYNLKNLDLSSFDTGNVTNMERMFGDWDESKTIDVSALETGKVTNMRRMFESCEDLEYLDLSSFDTSKLENMSEMFSGCTDLQKLNLGGLDFSKVSNTSNVFEDCRQINEIQTPIKLQASLALPDINGYPWVTSAGKIYSVMPQKQSKSFTIKLEDVIAIGGATYSNNWTLDADGNLIVTEGVAYKGRDGQLLPEWYPYADKIKHAEINAKYESKLDNLFAGCVNLESVNITNLDTSEAISMSGMFKGCEKLTEVDLSRMDTSLVKNMASMFEGCTSLKELNLETFDTKRLEDMSSMFKDCHNLTSVNMSSFNMDSIDIVGNPFEGCESLVKIHSPFNLWEEAALPQTEDMVWIAGNEVQTHLPMRTTDSTVLEKVSLVKETGTDQGQNWTVYTTGEMVVEPVQMRMFAMRRNLTTNAGWADYADIIKKVVIKGDNLTDISGYLNDCSKLEEIDLSEANLNNLIDASNVFANCTSLKVIYAPAGLERSILLPLTDGYVWEDEKGTAYTELPQGLEESVKLSLESAHALEEISRVEATCKDEGSIVYKCKDAYCEYTETVIIPVLTTHSYDEGKVTVKATCHTAGEKLYTCTVCEAEKTVKTSKLTDHSYKKEQILKKATDVRNGEKYLVCTDCEATKTVTIPKIKSVTLSTTKYVYDGKTKTPSVTVKDNAGKTLKKDVDYKISNPSSRKSVKRYTVTVTFKGAYSGTVKKDFVITPAAPKTASAQLYGYDDVKFSWSKVSGASGYNVYYKKYSAKSYTYLGATTKTSYKKANLADGTRYAFKVVPYYYDKSNKKKYESTANKAVTIYTLKKISTPKISKSGSKVKVKWTNISGETGYQISQSTKKSKTKIVSTYKTTSGSSKTIKATKKKTYYYKVRAYKTVNGKKIYGPWSSTVKYKRK